MGREEEGEGDLLTGRLGGGWRTLARCVALWVGRLRKSTTGRRLDFFHLRTPSLYGLEIMETLGPRLNQLPMNGLYVILERRDGLCIGPCVLVSHRSSAV